MKKLYVGNLPYSYDDAKLSELFTQFGSVQSAVVIIDRESRRSKGFGFVELDDSAADAAMKELDGKDIEGRALKVNEARPMNDKKRY